MGIILLDNSNSLLNSYLKGWELALKVFEEESSHKKRHRQRENLGKKNA